jgi:hypothetical protein
MKSRSYLMTIISLIAGLALFVYVIRQAGSQELLARVRSIGPGFLWVILVSGLRPVMRAWAWLRCLTPSDRRVGFVTLWRARLIGDAVSNLTTAGPLLGEPARLVFLSGRIPFAHAASSLSIEILSYLISCCVMMLAGVLALLTTFALSHSLRQASLLALFSLLIILAVAILIPIRRWSLVSVARAAVRRLIGHHRFGHWLDHQLHHLHRLEIHNLDFYRRRPRDFTLVCLCEAGFHLLGVLEIWIMLRLSGAEAEWIAAFIFEAVNRLINIAFAFVPVKVGVDEAGTALLAQALGMGALTGVTMAVYRKVRILFWTLLGLLFLAWPHRRQSQPDPQTEFIQE